MKKTKCKHCRQIISCKNKEDMVQKIAEHLAVCEIYNRDLALIDNLSVI